MSNLRVQPHQSGSLASRPAWGQSEQLVICISSAGSPGDVLLASRNPQKHFYQYRERYRPILETKVLLSKNVHFHILLPTLNFCLKLNNIMNSKKHSKEKTFTKVERRDSKYQGEQTYKVTFFFVSVVFFSRYHLRIF